MAAAPEVLQTVLLNRIGELEAQLKAVRDDLDATQAQLNNLGNAFENEIKSTSGHFKTVYERLRGIHIHLWPLVDKVFPGIPAIERQIASIFEKTGKDAET